jgi:hypothetical protein
MDWKGEVGKLCIQIVIRGFFFWCKRKHLDLGAIHSYSSNGK